MITTVIAGAALFIGIIVGILLVCQAERDAGEY